MPEAYDELMDILRTLERHYGDMQDTEFTVEEGSLYMLQTRNAKRPAQAAVRFAVDAVKEGLLDRERALCTIDAGALDALLHPSFARGADFEVLAEGVAASPGAARGAIVFTADDAVEAAEEGRDIILVRQFTEADDVGGFHAAQGHPHRGGRQGQPRGAGGARDGQAVRGGRRRARDRREGEDGPGRTAPSCREGDVIAIDGSAGLVTADEVPLEEPEVSDAFETVLAWADELRRLGVRTNADTPGGRAQGARVRRRGHRPLPHRAHVHGRGPPAQDAGDDHGRVRGASGARRSASCCRSSRATSRACSTRCAGLPVTIRLLDPPLHEFLPDAEELAAEVQHARDEGCPSWRSSSTRSTACTRWRRPTRCSAPAACAWACSIPRSTRCRCGRSCARPPASTSRRWWR